MYSSCFAQASYVIGEDGEYVYILALPTDIQHLIHGEDENNPKIQASEANHNVLLSGSCAVIREFMLVNGIEANESCPPSPAYWVEP